MEQTGIKALALKVMQRNSHRNISGTKGETERNKPHKHDQDRGMHRRAFDGLFNRFNRQVEHCITIDMIRQQDPKAAEEIMGLYRAMDSAWYREDLPAFRESMSKLEKRYLQAHGRITGELEVSK